MINPRGNKNLSHFFVIYYEDRSICFCRRALCPDHNSIGLPERRRALSEIRKYPECAACQSIEDFLVLVMIMSSSLRMLSYGYRSVHILYACREKRICHALRCQFAQNASRVSHDLLYPYLQSFYACLYLLSHSSSPLYEH